MVLLIASSPKMPFSIDRGFRKMLKEFLNNTSLSGYKYTIEKERSLYERGFWVLLHIVLMIVTIYLIVNLWFTFMENPTVTSLQTTSYPVGQVEFPAVAICNLNKISRAKAIKLSNYLGNFSADFKPEVILSKLYLLGHMYDFDSSNMEEFIDFQAFFDRFDAVANISLQPKNILRFLITSCEELLEACSWGGRNVNCSEIFEFRLTFEGYCCTFNYLKEPKYSELDQEPPKRKRRVAYQQAGYHRGLTVVVNNKPEDYFYSIVASIGVKVHIFHPTDYPDIASGSMSEQLIGSGTETFLAIMPTVFQTVDSVMRFPVEKRQCVFAKEKKTLLGEYSESDCFVDCKIKSMLSLCECVPFMIPIDNQDNVCTLADILCLNKYNVKWSSVAPADRVGEELSREIHDSLRCDSRCYPACEGTVYDVATNMVPLYIGDRNTTVGVNDSIIHVYFRKSFVHMYRQDVVYYWFEILSNFGGTFGLIIGLSLISVIEVIVYFTYKCIVYSRNN